MKRLAAALAAAALVVAAAAPARAQQTPADEAEALIRQGIELRHQNQDARALPLFERAYKLVRSPRTAAQLGLAKMSLGYWVDAERMLDEALAAPDHPWVARNVRTLQDARATSRRNIGEIAVSGSPAGAEILINGRPAGRLPAAQPIRVDKGAIELQLRAPGYVSATRALTIVGGARETLALALEPAAGTPATPPAPPATVAAAAPGPAPEATAAPGASLQVTSSGGGDAASAPGRPLPLRPLAWGAAIGAGAGLTLAIVETIVASSRIDAFNDHTAPSPTATDPNRRVADCATDSISPECKSILDAHDRARTLAIVGFVAAGALAATSAVLFVVSHRRAREATAFSCAPTVGTTPGLGCRITF